MNRLVLSCLFFAGILVGRMAEAQSAELPEFKFIKEAVAKAIVTEKNIQWQDLIDRTQATAALKAVRSLGWKPEDAKKILAAVPTADNFVVKQLRTPKGLVAMRKISAMPLGYDRLFRIGSLQNGRRLVYDVCQGTDGYRLIQYLTESSGGKVMGKMVSQAPHGADFNRPTGQIYTAPALIKQLKKSYDKQLAGDK